MKTFDEFIAESKIENLAKKANIDISMFDKKQLAMGIKVEKEHGPRDKDTDVTGGDPIKTLKIAIAHLREDPHYYTKLKKVEGE